MRTPHRCYGVASDDRQYESKKKDELYDELVLGEAEELTICDIDAS